METDGEPLALGRHLGVSPWLCQTLPPVLKFSLFLLLGSLGSCALEKDHFSSGDDAVEADNEDEAEPREDDSASAAEAGVGTNAGWADAMARILNKKIPESKPTILVRNRELEKEKEKLKRERLEKRKQVCPTNCSVHWGVKASSHWYRIVPSVFVQLTFQFITCVVSVSG